MTGEQLKKKLSFSGFKQSEIAEMLGTSPANFNAYLRGPDIRTGLLERICEVIGKDMSFFYPGCGKKQVVNLDESETTTYGDNSPAVVGGDYTLDQAVRIAVLEERIKQKDEQITLLKSLLNGK